MSEDEAAPKSARGRVKKIFLGIACVAALRWGYCYWEADQLEHGSQTIEARVSGWRPPGAKENDGDVYYEFEVGGRRYTGSRASQGSLELGSKITIFYCTQRPYLNQGKSPQGATGELIGSTVFVCGIWTVILGGLGFVVWLSKLGTPGRKPEDRVEGGDIGF